MRSCGAAVESGAFHEREPRFMPRCARSRVGGGSGRFWSGYARFVSVTPGNGEEHPPSGEWEAPPSGEWEAPPSAERDARRAERTQRREAATERPEVMIPSRGKRLPLEAPLMRVVATAGIIGIGVAIAAIMSSQDSKGWVLVWWYRSSPWCWRRCSGPRGGCEQRSGGLADRFGTTGAGRGRGVR